MVEHNKIIKFMQGNNDHKKHGEHEHKLGHKHHPGHPEHKEGHVKHDKKHEGGHRKK